MKKFQFNIGKRKVGDGQKCFVVAEMSANHAGNLNNAIKIVRLAKKCGADAIKLQTYTPNTITLKSKKNDFLISKKSPWFKYKNLWNLYNYAHTPWKWHKKIFYEAKKNNLSFFSSPFDETAVDYLEKLGCQAYKIASPEIGHLPLIKKVAKTGKPVILSTGLASYNEIKTARTLLKKNKCKKIIILKCTSAYPSTMEELNLKTMTHIRKKFNSLVGFSDHSLEILPAITASALGACMIEKHLKLEVKKNIDNFFSTGNKKFKKMVEGIRIAEKSIGKITYKITKNSKVSLNGKRSIYVSTDIKKGEKLTKKNIQIVRPSFGLNPKYYELVLKKKSLKNLQAGSRLDLKDLK